MPSVPRSQVRDKSQFSNRPPPPEPPQPTDLRLVLLAAYAHDDAPKTARDVVLELALAITTSADTLAAALRSPADLDFESAADRAVRIGRAGKTIRDLAAQLDAA